MATIDNRIVQLEFKNAEFNRAMAATIDGLKQLNESMATIGDGNGFAEASAAADDMKGRIGSAVKGAAATLGVIGVKAGEQAGRLGSAASRMAAALIPIGAGADKAKGKLEQLSSGGNFAKLSAAASRVDLSPISASVDKVSAKFVAFASIANAALSRITDKAINVASDLTSAFSIDLIGDGFDEYELKLGSIQTIMAGSGESLDVVTGKLEELNQYADDTIYSFADMTQNIGKFTNAGVDLDTAVASIQGVAQVAAVSGANTEEASRAMFNFAQALSKGYVQLVDWRSIDLANMGTVEFKQQLIDSAEASGELTKQGDAWVTKAGTMVTASKGFNESLTDQWLTTETLTTTLGRYSDKTTEIGKKAFAASSDIKTFTQLIDVAKESVGSGFASSFEILIGDFDEAKILWGDIGGALDDFIGKSAEARNGILNGWKALSGRDILIEALGDAFNNLVTLLKPIKDAFREIFPKKTSEDLVRMTKAFRDFITRMQPSIKTTQALKRIFLGFFSAIKIGINIFKAIGKSFKNFLTDLGVGSGAFLEFAATIGDFVTGAAKGQEAGEGLVGVLGSMDFGAVAAKAKKAFQGIIDFAQKMWATVTDIWTQMREWLSTIGSAIADAIDPTGFSSAGEVVSIALLGAIAAAMVKLIRDGISIDSGGILSSVSGALQELTGALTAMQENLRASALFKIAGSILILAISLAILAAIDAAALARATGAMTGLMSMLVGVTYALKAVAVGFAPARIAVVALGLLLISASILLLAFAMKKIGDLDIDQIGKGLLGIAGALGLFVAAIKLMDAGGGLVRAGASMIFMAIGLRIMASAMAAMGALDLGTIGRGLLGLAGSMAILVLAVNLMPGGAMIRAAVSIAILGVSLNIIALAMERFGNMDMDSIGIALYAIASALTILILAMSRMPPGMFVTALGLLAISVSLNLIGIAMERFAAMTWDEIGTGLYTLAASLTLLGIATKTMTTGLAGAAAIMLVALALIVLAKALKLFASIPWSDLLKGFLAMAIALGVLALAAAALSAVGPGLLIAGAGLVLIGAGIALIGFGALAVAKAIKILVEAGAGGIRLLIKAFTEFLGLMPVIVEAIIDALVAFVEGLPALLVPLAELLIQFIEMLVELTPVIEEAVVEMGLSLIRVLRELIPEFIIVGFEMLVALLTGIRDNIEQIIVLGAEIIINFLNGLAEKLPALLEAGANFIVQFLLGLIPKIPEIVAAGILVIVSFLQGLAQNVDKVITAAVDLIIAYIDGIRKNILRIIEAGKQLVIDFVKGIGSASGEVVKAAAETLADFLEEVGNSYQIIIDAGSELVQDLIEGIVGAYGDIVVAAIDAVIEFIEAVGGEARRLTDAGGDVIVDLIEGFDENADKVITAGVDAVLSFLEGVGDNAIALADGAFDVITTFINELANTIEAKSPELRDAGKRLAWALVDGATFGLASKAKSVADSFTGMLGGAVSAGMSFLGINSPSKVTMGMAHSMAEGMTMGLDGDKTTELATERYVGRVVDSMIRSMSKLPDSLEGLEEFNPVITPVLDLTRVEEETGRLAELVGLDPSVSAGYAGDILEFEDSQDDLVLGKNSGANAGVVFNQTINAPTELSATDIYRDTNNQLAVAKEELSIA